MDMRQLFDDFKKFVESLDDDAISQSIARAVEHSSNSSSLECESEKIIKSPQNVCIAAEIE